MKKLLLLLISSIVAASASAQMRNEYAADSLLSRWVIDVNLLGGLGSQTYTTANTTGNYLNGVNMNTGNLKYTNGSGYGADAQLGFFFGKKRHFGIGTGFMYLGQQGTAVLDNYHVEYQATDAAGNTYRQLITGNNVKESINSTNYNIPLVLKYKNRFSKHWGFAADAGALINLQTMNAYNSHANFDYEAIYQYAQGGDGGLTTVYDNAPTPSSSDLMVTKAEFLKNNPNGNVQDYFNAERAAGFNVGLNHTPANSKGNVNSTQASVGLIVKPSLNYFLSDNVALDFGLFFIYQPFRNTAQSGYRLTDGINGPYNSVLNSVTSVNDEVYGINFGVRFFLGKSHPIMYFSSIDQNAPTQCGLCDGSIVLHGLCPNQQVTVDYSLNGAQPGKYTTTVQTDSAVKISGLCAGNYSGIVAKIKKKNATTKDITLVDPSMNISSQMTTNPTLEGQSNGSVMFNGLYGGLSVTIKYNMNGVAQQPYTGMVNSDNSVTIGNLGEGHYTNIVATINKCSANGTDFTLAAPAPPPAPEPAMVHIAISDPVNKNINVSTPILFDVNKATIHESSYAVIDEAVEDLKENKGSYLIIDGNADSTGRASFNDTLALSRAMAIKRALTERGINPDRLKAIGHGSREPVATNRTYEGKQENRNGVMKMKFSKKKKTTKIADSK